MASNAVDIGKQIAKNLRKAKEYLDIGNQNAFNEYKKVIECKSMDLH